MLGYFLADIISSEEKIVFVPARQISYELSIYRSRCVYCPSNSLYSACYKMFTNSILQETSKFRSMYTF